MYKNVIFFLLEKFKNLLYLQNVLKTAVFIPDKMNFFDVNLCIMYIDKLYEKIYLFEVI